MNAGGDAVTLQLPPAHECDPSELLDFEVENRAYFPRWMPDRGHDYFSLDAVAPSLKRARQWWEAGTDRHHVAVDADDRFVEQPAVQARRRARARNPYGDEHGVTIEDPDGYRLELCRRSWLEG